MSDGRQRAQRLPWSSSAYEAARLARIAAHVEGRRILDIGYAQMPNAALTGADRHVTGIDINPAPADSPYDAHLQGDIFSLPDLDDGQIYDCIVAGEFIEHLERPYDLLRSLKRSLAESGRLIVSTPNPVGFPVLLCEWMRSRGRFYAKDHTYYFAPRWCERLIEDSGYRLSSVEGVGLWPTRIPCPAGLSYQVIYVAQAL